MRACHRAGVCTLGVSYHSEWRCGAAAREDLRGPHGSPVGCRQPEEGAAGAAGLASHARCSARAHCTHACAQADGLYRALAGATAVALVDQDRCAPTAGAAWGVLLGVSAAPLGRDRGRGIALTKQRPFGQRTFNLKGSAVLLRCAAMRCDAMEWSAGGRARVLALAGGARPASYFRGRTGGRWLVGP
jgi:hypothetical protein